VCPTDGSFGACCDLEAPCTGELACLGAPGLSFCTQRCGIEDTTCPEGAGCILVEGENLCVPHVGAVGDPCDSEESGGCRPGLFCLADMGMGFCTAVCDFYNLCPSKDLVGDRVCVELTDNFGAYCTRPCEDATDCAFGLSCDEVPHTGWSVCFPPAQ
jgi:hypothetical protein